MLLLADYSFLDAGGGNGVEALVKGCSSLLPEQLAMNIEG